MTKVTKIDWTVQTGDGQLSGTDTPIHLEIYRNNELLKRLSLEPGRTPRLNRGERATYYWTFEDPDGIGVAISGTAVPYYEIFPDGVAGHLHVKLIAKGDDQWEKVSITSRVYSGTMEYIPGTIDSFRWTQTVEQFVFDQRKVLSTDRSEGFTSLTLEY